MIRGLVCAAVLVVVGQAAAGVRVAPSGPASLALTNDIAVQFDEYGAIKGIHRNATVLIERGKIIAQLLSSGGSEPVGISQTWGMVLDNRTEVEMAPHLVKATGVLISKENSDPGRGIDFVVQYKKETDGSLGVRVEVSCRADTEFKSGPLFGFDLPLAIFQGSTCETVEGNGMTKSYELGEQPVKFQSYGARVVTVRKGGLSVTVKAGEVSQLKLLDARTWKGTHIVRVDVMPKQKWAASHQVRKDSKQTFEANVSFRIAE